MFGFPIFFFLQTSLLLVLSVPTFLRITGLLCFFKFTKIFLRCIFFRATWLSSIFRKVNSCPSLFKLELISTFNHHFIVFKTKILSFSSYCNGFLIYGNSLPPCSCARLQRTTWRPFYSPLFSLSCRFP